MKFLLDQDVYATTVRFLSELGHDVIPVAQIGLAQAKDEELLKTDDTVSWFTPVWTCKGCQSKFFVGGLMLRVFN